MVQAQTTRRTKVCSPRSVRGTLCCLHAMNRHAPSRASPAFCEGRDSNVEKDIQDARTHQGNTGDAGSTLGEHDGHAVGSSGASNSQGQASRSGGLAFALDQLALVDALKQLLRRFLQMRVNNEG
jgi:hypothetical protein